MSWQAASGDRGRGGGGVLSEAELSALIGIVDEDEDGCVSFAEFLRLGCNSIGIFSAQNLA